MENGMILNNPVITLTKQIDALEHRIKSDKEMLANTTDDYNRLVIAIHEGERLANEYRRARSTLVASNAQSNY